MLWLVLDLTLGALLLAAIALSSRAPAQRSDRVRLAGWTLVALPLPAAVAIHLANLLPRTTDQSLFVTGVVSFAIGSALLLGSRENDDWREAGDDSPPWWPEFEREFRRYADGPRTKPRPRVLV